MNDSKKLICQTGWNGVPRQGTTIPFFYVAIVIAQFHCRHYRRRYCSALLCCVFIFHIYYILLRVRFEIFSIKMQNTWIKSLLCQLSKWIFSFSCDFSYSQFLRLLLLLSSILPLRVIHFAPILLWSRFPVEFSSFYLFVMRFSFRQNSTLNPKQLYAMRSIKYSSKQINMMI